MPTYYNLISELGLQLWILRLENEERRRGEKEPIGLSIQNYADFI